MRHPQAAANRVRLPRFWFMGLWGLAWVAALVLGGPSIARAEALRIGLEGDYPPFSYKEADGTPAGFDIDIARALCAAMQAECVLQVVPWVEIIPTLNDGKIDAIVASMSITEERKKLVAFTNRYYRTPMQFVARRGSGITGAADSLRGRTVAVEGDTTAQYYLRDHMGEAVKAVVFKTQSDATQALASGKTDALLADSLVMWQFLKSPEGQAFEFVGEPIYVDEGIGIALRKADAELLRRFNQAIARIRLDGTYQKINAKYFPFSIY